MEAKPHQLRPSLKKHIEEIVPLTNEEFSYVYSLFGHRSCRKGESVIQKGGSVSEEFWVVSGCLKGYVTDSSGKSYVIQFASGNWWITDYRAYFNAEPATMNIECIEDAELLTLTLANRQQICRDLPKMETFFNAKFDFGYISFQQRAMSLLSHSSEEKYRYFNSKYPSLMRSVPRKYMAEFLNISQEMLSRLDRTISAA